MDALDTLKEFLSYPLNSSEEIMDRFRGLPNAIWKKGLENQQQFVFVKGNREDAATIIAHADTVFSNFGEHDFIEEDGIIKSTTPNCGLGADDRAGCAILWLLKDSGHHLLITDGEERGQIGARWLMREHKDIASIIHQSSFMMQFDRRHGTDYKVYHIPVTEEFKQYIESETGYTEPNKGSFTDIVSLCNHPDSCCGVNLSVGYRNEHYPDENLNIQEWENTLQIATKMLAKPLERYPLDPNEAL